MRMPMQIPTIRRGCRHALRGAGLRSFAGATGSWGHTKRARFGFALVKRGIIGTYHNVSKEYLHRYLWQFDFVWNTRKMNDGERTISAIKSAEGKRLMYSEATAPHA